MDIKNLKSLAYQSPIGEELQHVSTGENEVSLHSDTYLLTRMSELNLSNNMLELIKSRLQEVPSSISSELQESIDKVNDFEKMQFADSRYMQTLSDRKNAVADMMRKFDEEKAKIQDSAQKEELSTFERGLRDLVKRYASS